MTEMEPATDQPLEPGLREELWVGEWRVAPDLNQIARSGIVVRLEPKAMAVLLHLASQPRQVASRDELLAAGWPGIVVGDNALTQVIIKLRKALGDTAREPVYVQSIAKKGYRLIADVRRSGAPPPQRPAVAPPAPDRSWPAAHRAGLVLAAALLVGAVVWIVQSAGGPAPTLEAANSSAESAPSAAPPTVLVKPFEDLGAETRQSLIARAVTADLITDLSKVSGIRVASGSGSAEPPDSAGRTQAQYVLSGTVQEDGDRLRLNVLFTETASGRQLWSERFDRQITDLFSVQDNLVKSILEVLPVKLNEAQTLRLARRHTRNLQAYEQFIRAQAAILVRRPAQNGVARDFYWNAIRLDPAFARAYAGVAMTYALDYQQGWTRDGDAALDRALDLAETSIKMRPDMPEAHWVLGFVRAQRRQHAQALQDLASALRLNPSYADAYALMAGIHTYIGKPAEAIPLLRAALRLNPDAGSLYFLLLGRAYYFLGDSQQARVNLNHSLERNAESLEARIYLAAACWLAGDRESARWQVNEIRSLEPGFNAAEWLATYPMTDPAQAGRLQVSMAEMGL